jgi:serine/threonine protein kinase
MLLLLLLLLLLLYLLQVDLHSGHVVSQQVDIWALGVLLYKLAFGRTPFEGNTGHTVMFRHYCYLSATITASTTACTCAHFTSAPSCQCHVSTPTTTLLQQLRQPLLTDTRGDVQNLGILNGFVAASGVPSNSPYSPGLSSLLELCMDPSPAARPTAGQVIKQCEKMRVAGTLPYWPSVVDDLPGGQSAAVTVQQQQQQRQQASSPIPLSQSAHTQQQQQQQQVGAGNSSSSSSSSNAQQQEARSWPPASATGGSSSDCAAVVTPATAANGSQQQQQVTEYSEYSAAAADRAAAAAAERHLRRSSTASTSSTACGDGGGGSSSSTAGRDSRRVSGSDTPGGAAGSGGSSTHSRGAGALIAAPGSPRWMDRYVVVIRVYDISSITIEYVVISTRLLLVSCLYQCV